jgi:hypothetical protein
VADVNCLYRALLQRNHLRVALLWSLRCSTRPSV